MINISAVPTGAWRGYSRGALSISLPPLLETLLDGRYRLKSVLGEGGMGRVYDGEDLRLGRRVAVKVMLDDNSGDESLGERFFREAKAAARADHPAVVTTFGCGTDLELGISYVVMERLQGETVEARIRRIGPLPLALIVRIALETADALAAVHAADVIHRDLKPTNLFLATRGRRVDQLKLLDFGVAKQLDLPSLTTTGQVYGTPMYMAPEQLQDSKRVDARCDLYSLGAVLLECATGKPPFRATQEVALIAEIVFGESPKLRGVRADLNGPLAEVIERCLAKRASDRYPSALAVIEALAPLAQP